MKNKKCCCDKVSIILVLIGAINWGLIGIGALIFSRNWNVINLILGRGGWLEAIIYIIVGIAAVKLIYSYLNGFSTCLVGGKNRDSKKEEEGKKDSVVENMVEDVKDFGEKVGDKIEDVVEDIKEEVNERF